MLVISTFYRLKQEDLYSKAQKKKKIEKDLQLAFGHGDAIFNPSAGEALACQKRHGHFVGTVCFSRETASRLGHRFGPQYLPV